MMDTRRPPTVTPRRLEQGTSLIEVLVAALILTLGLLSMISMHAASIRYGKLAEFRSSASQLAEDYGDRMRANSLGVRNGNYNRNVVWSANPTRVTDPGVSCTVATCSADQIAAQVAASDQVQWLNSAIGMLPAAGLFAQKPAGVAANASVMDVWVMWLEPGGDTQNATQDQTLNDAFACPAGANAGANVRCLRYRLVI
jgi:type IV pilus assembly protein PilV